MAKFRNPKRKLLAVLLFVAAIQVLTCSRRQQISADFLLTNKNEQKFALLPDARVKNIILYIGDGMGIAEITTARLSKTGVSGRLTMEKMPVTGLEYTQSSDNLITDSAAGATALATGFKTNNGMISVSPTGRRLETILEAAQNKGMRTGLVVTSEISHATPACFASHVKSRHDQDSIAVQLIAHGVDVLLGGGKKYFLPVTRVGSGRKDSLDLIAVARRDGYRFVETAEQLRAVSAGKILGLFAMGGMTTRAPEPSLQTMTEKALQLLAQDNQEGFFLMVEGSQIDWAGHANDVEDNIYQTLQFDAALESGIKFARKNGHTLIVVTADHETGEMSINGGTLDGKKLDIRWTTHHHTGVPVGIFAYGPHALNFMGYHDNTEIPRMFARLLRIPDFPLGKNQQK